MTKGIFRAVGLVSALTTLHGQWGWSMALERELETYKRKLPELKEHQGKFALIRGDDVVDVYSSYEDAIKAGYDRFGLEPFLVKQIQSVEQVQLVTRLVVPGALPARA